MDGQFTAIAAVNDMVLVTVNVKHFARFKGIAAESWSKRHN